jgi:hypothetical protein
MMTRFPRMVFSAIWMQYNDITEEGGRRSRNESSLVVLTQVRRLWDFLH